MPTKVRRNRPRRPRRLMKRAPAACGPRFLRPALWSHRKRSKSTPWSATAVNSHFGRGPKPRSRAIELEGGGGARRGAISALECPRVPRPSVGPAGSRSRVYEMRITRPAELSPRPRISAATGRLHYELTTDAILNATCAMRKRSVGKVTTRHAQRTIHTELHVMQCTDVPHCPPGSTSLPSAEQGISIQRWDRNR